MANTHSDDLVPRLAVIRRQQLSLLAKMDPTLLLLKRALARDREIRQMDGHTLLTYLRDLEARYGHPDPA